MSKVSEIVISRTTRMNTGNYEGTEYFVSMKMELDELDDAEHDMEDLQNRVDQAMIQQLMLAYKARKKVTTKEQVCIRHGFNDIYSGSK